MKKIKTLQQLKTYCQAVANLTGCIVTVERWGNSKCEVFINDSVTKKEHLKYNCEWFNELDTNDTNSWITQGTYSISIPDPENWIFEPSNKEMI